MAFDGELAERIASAFSDRSDVEAKRMMGGVCYMVAGHMCCAASRNGMMVRVGRDGYADALQQAGVSPLEMGGRSPAGYVLIDPALITKDAALRRWIARAVTVVEALPPRPLGQPKPRVTRSGRARVRAA